MAQSKRKTKRTPRTNGSSTERKCGYRKCHRKFTPKVPWQTYCSAVCGDKERHAQMYDRYRTLRQAEASIRRREKNLNRKRKRTRPASTRASVLLPPRVRNRRVNPRSLETAPVSG